MKNIKILDLENNILGEILFFELDSIETVKNRISRLLAIPPKFLYTPLEIKLDNLFLLYHLELELN